MCHVPAASSGGEGEDAATRVIERQIVPSGTKFGWQVKSIFLHLANPDSSEAVAAAQPDQELFTRRRISTRGLPKFSNRQTFNRVAFR